MRFKAIVAVGAVPEGTAIIVDLLRVWDPPPEGLIINGKPVTPETWVRLIALEGGPYDWPDEVEDMPTEPGVYRVEVELWGSGDEIFQAVRKSERLSIATGARA